MCLIRRLIRKSSAISKLSKGNKIKIHMKKLEKHQLILQLLHRNKKSRKKKNHQKINKIKEIQEKRVLIKSLLRKMLSTTPPQTTLTMQERIKKMMKNNKCSLKNIQINRNLMNNQNMKRFRMNLIVINSKSLLNNSI